MPYALGLVSVSLTLLSLWGGPAFSQRRRAPEDQIKLAQRFFAQEKKCRDLLRGEMWREAEAACKAAVGLADRFADYRELEKMGAYESVGRALNGQGRYQEAIGYYTRALEVGRPRVDDTDAEAGSLYGSIAMAYHAMRNLDQAREFYRKAERTFQHAYDSINVEEVTEEGVRMRQGYLSALKKILGYHLLAAQEAGAGAEVEEVKKRLGSLP